METETAKSRITRAAAIISESPLAEHLPKYHAEAMARILSGEADTAGYISVDFRSSKAATSVCLYVSTNSEGFETAENGDSYFIQSVSTGTSWPSHGSATPELNAQRLAFMTQVNDLAARIGAAVDGQVRTLHRTAAEVAEAKAERERKAAEAKLQRIAADAVTAVCKAMRVGSKRDVPFKLVEELKGTSLAGKVWNVSGAGGKAYELRVYSFTAEAVRTA